MLWPGLAFLSMALGGVLGLVVSRRPEWSVAGRRVDHHTVRSFATLSLGVAMLVLGAADLAEGDLFGLATLGTAAFTGVIGVGTMLRSPHFVPGMVGGVGSTARH